MSLSSDTEHAADTLTRIATHLAQLDRNRMTVVDRIRLCVAGHPRAASYDSDRVTASGSSDPTGTAATSNAPDTAAADLRRAHMLAATLRRTADQLADLLARYPEPRAASAWEREQTARENDPRCESCCRIEIVKGVPWWVEPHVNGSGAPYRTTVDDKLAEAMYLCKACIGHVTSRGCLPNEDELEQRRAHGRIKRCPHPEVNEDAA